MLIELLQIANNLGQGVQLYNQLIAIARAQQSQQLQQQLLQNHHQAPMPQIAHPIIQANLQQQQQASMVFLANNNRTSSALVRQRRTTPIISDPSNVMLNSINSIHENNNSLLNDSQCKPLDLSVASNNRKSSSVNRHCDNNYRLRRNHIFEQQHQVNGIFDSNTNRSNQEETTKLLLSITSSTSPIQASSCSTTSNGSASGSDPNNNQYISNKPTTFVNVNSTTVDLNVSSTHSIIASSSSPSSSISISSNTTNDNNDNRSTLSNKRQRRRQISTRRSNQADSKTVISKKPNKIKITLKSTKNQVNNKHHQQVDSQILKSHLCNDCGRSFARSDMLTRHSRLHSGVKPYKCSRCHQIFSRSDHLSTHERTHTGEKPYQCQQCPYSACRRDMITRHMRTHSANRTAATNNKSKGDQKERKQDNDECPIEIMMSDFDDINHDIPLVGKLVKDDKDLNVSQLIN